jgi:membrane-associated phospholipid phosphatase
MRFFKKHLLICIAVLPVISSQAQYTTAASAPSANDTAARTRNFPYPQSSKQVKGKSFILPGMLVVYGISSLGSNTLKSFNKEMKEEIWQERPHKQLRADDYLRFTPAAAAFALNAFGIKGQNNLRDKGMIFLMSNLFLSGAVTGLKKFTHEQRPDGSDYLSFPSGHTAQAFASAEFLRQEYKDVSPWYGIAGYAAAAATGALRMYNNKHWLSDVVAGAGIGIASTRLAYLVYPAIRKKLFKDKPVNTMVMPYYQSGGAGLALVYNFH